MKVIKNSNNNTMCEALEQATEAGDLAVMPEQTPEDFKGSSDCIDDVLM